MSVASKIWQINQQRSLKGGVEKVFAEIFIRVLENSTFIDGNF